MMGRKIIFRIIIVSVICIILIYLSTKIFDAARKIKIGYDSFVPPLHSISYDDSVIISKKYYKNISANLIYRSKIRNNVTFMNFDSTFNIIRFKINTLKNFSLKGNVKIIKENSDKTVREDYRRISFNDYYTYYDLLANTNPAKQIEIRILTDSLDQVIDSDSCLSYNVTCENLSIRYLDKEPVDVFIEGKQLGGFKFTSIHMNFMVVKRNNIVSMLIMTPNVSGKSISPKLLYNIYAGIAK
jgi:hypothetical protein